MWLALAICLVLVVIYYFNKELATFVAYVFGGSIIIWLTNRRATAMEDNVRAVEKGQSIARFESTVKLLENKSPPIIVGAVYALDRMAHDEPKYLEPVFNVLCELIRQKNQETPSNARKIAAKLIFGPNKDGTDRVYHDYTAHLESANLSGWDLSEMTLTNAELQKADLTGASLKNTDMTGANLTDAKIDTVKTSPGTVMQSTILQGVQVSSGQFKEIDFSKSDMRTGTITSSFKWCNFSGCDFKDAHLRHADFHGSDFTDVKNLTDDQLSSARSLYGVQGLSTEQQKRLKKENPALFLDSET